MIRKCPSCTAKNRIPNGRLHQEASCGKCHTQIGALDRPLPMKDAASFEALIRESKVPVLVDFWADWCGPCKMIAPELNKLARSKAGSLVIAKVDTEKLQAVAGRYGIRSIPTMILFKDGREADRKSGAMGAAQIASAFGL